MAHSRCVPSQPRGDKSGECGVTGLSHRRSAESQAKWGVDPTDVHPYICPQMYVHIYVSMGIGDIDMHVHLMHIYVSMGIALELGTSYVYASYVYALYVYASYGYCLRA